MQIDPFNIAVTYRQLQVRANGKRVPPRPTVEWNPPRAPTGVRACRTRWSEDRTQRGRSLWDRGGAGDTWV